MPTYNAAAYLNESIDSILGQTFADFDLYVYDDCSTDNTGGIISRYNDIRLFYRRNIENLGIARTLNMGLEELLPHYEYIARMDADDWASPERFQKQVEFLDSNQEVVLCGTQGYWLKDISQNLNSGWKYPTRHEYIKYYLLFAASFHHQSIVLQSKFFIKTNLRYNESIATCEDWDLWTRVIKDGAVANLREFLVRCRILPFSNHHSPLNKKKHLEERSEIISNYWAEFNYVLSPEQVYEYYYGNGVVSKTDFIKKVKLLINAFNLLYSNAKNNLVLEDRESFRYIMARRILDFWKRCKVSRLDLMIWIMIVREVKFMNKIKLIRSIIR